MFFVLIKNTSYVVVTLNPKNKSNFIETPSLLINKISN
jgi:hypothetical protein